MSIQTINGSIISNYPVFEGSQVLTSEQLNGMFDYLDQQNRFTRSRLIGIGIVCGLDIQLVMNQVILSEGIGITSDGFIVKMPQCTMKYQRDYFLPSTVAYEAFGSYDTDNIFTQDDDIILYELLSNKPAEGHFQDLTQPFLEDKYLLIFLECFDRDPRSCLGKNCEDLGKERIFTTRKLAVDQKGLNKILSKTGGGIENPFYPDSSLTRVDLKKPLFDPDGEECKELKSFVMHYKALLYETGNTGCVHHLLFGQGEGTGLLQATYSEFQPLLEPAYNYQNPFHSNPAFAKVKSALRSYLAGGTGDNLKGVQQVYEFYELLIDTYHEFMDVGARIAQACCPDKDFSLHLIIGKIVWDHAKEMDEWGLLGQSRYRHQFLQPKILNSQSVLLKELISLHHKILLLVESFEINVIKEKSVNGVDETIKITPLDPDSGAIPRYLIPDQKGAVPGIQTTDLETQWHFDTTVTGKTPIRIRSYDRNGITHSTLFPAQSDFVTAPLHYRTSESTYKAEAIFGEALSKVLDGESSIRDTYHLPFTILPVKINPNTENILVEPHYWQDLQTAYNVTRGELNVAFKNLIGHLKEFEKNGMGVDYGLTTVNMHNFKREVDQVLSQISVTEGLVEQGNKLVSRLPQRIEDFYDNGAIPNPFQHYYDDYRTFRRNLHKNFLRLWYANEILVREKLEVLEPELFQMWQNWVQWPSLAIKAFLSNNDFFQLHKLYYSFVVRYKFLQENHYSILCNFLQLHPGIDSNAIRNDGTHVLIYEEGGTDELDGESENIVFANFTLPYRLDPNKIDIPLDNELENAKLPPLARGESILLQQGQIRLIDSIANDLEPNGQALRVDSKGSVNDDDEFISGASYGGNKVISHGGVNSLLRYEPLKSFSGSDHFQYTIESESDDSLQDTAFVEVLVVPPYRKHIRATDDLAATNNHHSINISILDNDVDYPGIKVILPTKSAFGANLTLLSDNKVNYKPVYGREGKDTFKYSLQYEFMSETGPQVEVSEAEVEVIVFCCNRTEFEVICEGNPGEFQVLSAREIGEKVTLKLINDDREPVDRIIVDTDHFIEVREKNGESYLFYQPEVYFKGKETYVYEVTDSQGFMRRVKLEILVLPCTKTFLRRVLRETAADFFVLEEGQKDVFLFIDRNNPQNNLKTEHGEVQADGTKLTYDPDEAYVGLDFFEFGYRDERGVIHYHTMQVVIDGTERVSVESTFQDTPATFSVISNSMLSEGYTLKLFLDKGTFLDEVDTGDGRLITVDDGDLVYHPKTSFIGDDSFHYAILKDGDPYEYGKFFIIVDTNRKVQVEYTLRDLPKDIRVLTEDQVEAGASLAINSPPTIIGSNAEVVHPGSGAPFIRYTPAESYVGQDSFGYVITVGDVKLYGTVYVIVDSNERIELVNVYKNKTQAFQLYDSDQIVTEFDILETPRHGILTQLPDNVLQFIPNDDYTGTDKIKYRARVGGSIQYGTVFMIVSCECKDIVVTGTVSENAPTFPTIEGVRVEEIGTGKHVFTGASGVFSIQAAPNAKLRFSKDHYEIRETDIAYRSTLNVQMDRKEITIKGMVRNADTSQPLSDVSVVNQLGTTFSDANGDYSLIVYAGTRIDYVKSGFVSAMRNAGSAGGALEVDMEPIKVKTTGGVYDIFGKVIEDAYYEVSGKQVPTTSGSFDFEVAIGTSVTFGAAGYDSALYLADAHREGLSIVLNRSLITVTGTVTNAETDDPLEATDVVTGESSVLTDEKGYFELEARPGGPLDFSKEGFNGISLLVPETKEELKVSLEPVQAAIEVTVSGLVVEEVDGQFLTIEDAYYEVSGKQIPTTSGSFDFKVSIGTTLIFGAEGYNRKLYLADADREGLNIALYQGPPIVLGIITNAYTGEPISSVAVNNDYITFHSDDKGFFQVEAKSGDYLDIIKRGFLSTTILVSDPLEVVKIELEPVESKFHESVSGTVNERTGDSFSLIPDASFEMDGQVFPAIDGRFHLAALRGTEVIFRAPGFRPATIVVGSTVYKVQVVLTREPEDE